MPTATETPLHVARVTLIVRGLEEVGDFYQRAIGLERISGDADGLLLGAGGRGFLSLVRDPAARISSHQEAGLFHTAFLLPTRADLGRWVRHAADLGLRIDGAADHVVSEAIYLADPEGNGIEVYRDRAPAEWTWDKGAVVMRNDRLDLQGLASAGGETAWHGAPEGAVIGHVHLQVGELRPAEAFYKDRLGLDITCRYPGATFFSSGGYHHHIATNIWNSRGAPVRQGGATGLAEVELAATGAILDAVGSRLGESAVPVDGQRRLQLRDPWGTAIALRA